MSVRDPDVTARHLDCVVAGSCVADILCRPVDLSRAVGAEAHVDTEPAVLSPGGLTANAGLTLARLGCAAGVFSRVGDDAWGAGLRDAFANEGVDTAGLATVPGAATSTTVVLVDSAGERAFLHHGGAHRGLRAADYLSHEAAALWARSRWLLLGYYPLMPDLQSDLPEVFAAVRAAGCKVALESAGGFERGGTMDPLAQILPHVDLYVPSWAEARSQTGCPTPRAAIEHFRGCGATGVLGVKRGGAEGVLLQDAGGVWVDLPSAAPPGPVVDTTGAGDSFMAGLVAGLAGGASLADAARLACAVAAATVCVVGGNAPAAAMKKARQVAGSTRD